MDALTPLLYALIALAALIAAALVYRRYGWAPALAVGAFLVGLLGLLPAAWRLLQPPPERPRPAGPRPLEVEAAAREAEAKKAADKAHAEAVAEKEAIDRIADPDERTRQTADWFARHRRRRGSFTPPGWLVGLLVVVVIALLLSAGCAPRTAPPVFSLPLLPIAAEVLAEPAPPTLADDACDAHALVPGSPLPPEIVGVALRDGKPSAACRGVIADDAELRDYGACLADRTRLQSYLAEERASRERDRVQCEGVHTEDWTREVDLRRDNRALRWAGWGLGLGGIVLGVVVGYAAGSLP